MIERQGIETPSTQLSGEQRKVIGCFEQTFHTAMQDPCAENIAALLEWVDIILFSNVGVEATKFMESLRLHKHSTVNGRVGTISYQEQCNNEIEKHVVDMLRFKVLEAMADPTTSPLCAVALSGGNGRSE